MANFKIRCPSCHEEYSLPDSWKDGLVNKELTCDECRKPWVPFPATGFLKSAPKPLPIDLSVYRTKQPDLFGPSSSLDSPSPPPDSSFETTERIQIPPVAEPSLRVFATGPGVDVRAVYSLGDHGFLIGQSGCHINLPTEPIPQQAVRIRPSRSGFTFEGLGGFQPQVGSGPAAEGTIAPGKGVQMKIGAATLLFEVSSTPGTPIPDLDGAPKTSPSAPPRPRTQPPAYQLDVGASVRPKGGLPPALAELGDTGGTIRDLMADGVARHTQLNPLEGLDIGFGCLEGPNRGKGHRITKTPTLIGRTTGDLIIPDGRVSGKHAQLDILGPGQYLLKDLASTNGTMVNDRPISTTRLENGDIVSFGGVRFQFVARPKT